MAFKNWERKMVRKKKERKEKDYIKLTLCLVPIVQFLGLFNHLTAVTNH